VRFRRSARGAAIISVLLTVALATLIVSGLFFREQVTVRSVENRIALTQTRWVERAAIDWSKVILAADARTAAKMDHLGEPWAVPVEETRLDETVTAGARIDDDSRAATLSGAITDAQGRFNLNNLLIQPEGEEIQRSILDTEIFERLLDLLGLPTSLASALAARLLAAAPGKASAESVSLAARDEPQEVALPLIRVGDLITVRGFDADAVADLEAFVTFLPQNSQPRPTVNVNTASAEVLAAVLDVGIGQARQLADKRDRTPYQELAVFKNDANALNENISEDIFSRLSLNSKYFLVRGLIRFGRVESLSETLLHRTDNRRVNVIWQRRL
jgi:general secretion pathway protein K